MLDELNLVDRHQPERLVRKAPAAFFRFPRLPLAPHAAIRPSDLHGAALLPAIQQALYGVVLGEALS
jgi:hypothetical protein